MLQGLGDWKGVAIKGTMTMLEFFSLELDIPFQGVAVLKEAEREAGVSPRPAII